jgi:hypothetical protein
MSLHLMMKDSSRNSFLLRATYLRHSNAPKDTYVLQFEPTFLSSSYRSQPASLGTAAPAASVTCSVVINVYISSWSAVCVS